MSKRRISDEPAFVLHSYDWSESSLILEVFTRHQGRVALAAKGVKKPHSSFRPVLLPLQPLRLGWRVKADENAEIHTLGSAEWAGAHVMPQGAALLAGLYCNELLLRLLARDDPHAALFDIYAQAVCALALPGDICDMEPVLRSFELLLLRELGYLPALHEESASLEPLHDGGHYALSSAGGLGQVQAQAAAALGGAHWRALGTALHAPDGVQRFAATRRVIENGSENGNDKRSGSGMAQALKAQLRALLQYHCGPPLLRTRQLMMQLHQL